MHKLVVSIVVALAAMRVPATSQDKGPEPPTFRSVSTDLVVLPVTVTDRSGRFVSDLPQNAFIVRDNGAQQPLLFFSNEDTPVSIGLIIDNSYSMRTKLGEVVAATSAFARSSNPDDELFALAFNDEVREALPGRRAILASDVDQLQQAVSSLAPNGRTSLYDAIAAGLMRLEEAARARKVLIVLSDGGDNASDTPLEEVVQMARQSDAEIYTIGLFDADDRDRNPKVLQELAKATGGERFLPRSAGPLMEACQRIAHEIRSGYTLAYEPPVHDGSYRHVDVEVTTGSRRRMSVRTRPGYVALDRRRDSRASAPAEGGR